MLPTYEQFLNEDKRLYGDYPEAAKKAAQKALDWKKEHGDDVKGGTEVGWNRARQLASGTKLTRGELGKMASFMRHKKNSKIDPKHKNTPWKDRGHVAWALWGGDAGVNWAINKIKSLNKNG